MENTVTITVYHMNNEHASRPTAREQKAENIEQPRRYTGTPLPQFQREVLVNWAHAHKGRDGADFRG